MCYSLSLSLNSLGASVLSVIHFIITEKSTGDMHLYYYKQAVLIFLLPPL